MPFGDLVAGRGNQAKLLRKWRVWIDFVGPLFFLPSSFLLSLLLRAGLEFRQSFGLFEDPLPDIGGLDCQVPQLLFVDLEGVQVNASVRLDEGLRVKKWGELGTLAVSLFVEFFA